MRQAHSKWIGEKAAGSFLEIGCFSGSDYTFDLLHAASRYTGIELSSAACNSLRQKIKSKNLSDKATIVCGDVLEYQPKCKFDLVYAHGVLHHFENPAPLFAGIRELIADDGFLVFVEPVAINPVYRALRADAEWEWPFRKTTVAELTQRFEIVDGFGWGRFSALISMICAVPVVGSVVLPSYKWIAQKEIATPFQSCYWQSSQVIAKCLPRAA